MISFVTAMCLCIIPMFVYGRRLVSKSTSGSFTWTAYKYTYSFNATAGLTYNNSNNLTSISDLSFSNIICKPSNSVVTGSIIPRQSSKTYFRKIATYVVTVTRTTQVFYTDKVNYTYRTADAGTPYSLGDELALVDVIKSEPYDI